MHWLAQCLEPAKWPKGSKEFQHPPRIEPKLPDSLEITLTTEPWVCINLLKKNRIWLVIFWVMDCCSWIAKVEYQGHTLYTRSKPLISTSYHIQHRLELKYFYFAQFLLNAHQAGHWPEKVRTEKLKFRTDLQDQVMDGWSATQ